MTGLVERLAEIIQAFHADALSSAVNLNVDLDIMLCVQAQALLAALRQRLPGCAGVTPDVLQRRFLETPGTIITTPDAVTVRLDRRAYAPSSAKPTSPTTPPSPGGATAPSATKSRDHCPEPAAWKSALTDPTRSQSPGPAAHRTFASLEVPAFRLLLAGWLAAGTGAWVQRIAQDWLVLTLTDSPAAVGVATTCQFLPTLLLGLHGGALADALPRRRILMSSQVAMGLIAAVLAVLTATGRVEVWHVYGLALVLGLVNAVDNPARQSFLVETVGVPRLRNAISLLSLTFQVGAMMGPLLSGVLMVTAGTEYAFAVTAVTYLVPLTVLARLRPQDPPAPLNQDRARVRDGVRYALRTPTVLWPRR